MVPGAVPDYSTVVELSIGHAIVAGAGFSSWTYRLGFDVSLPVYSPLVTRLTPDTRHKFARYRKQSCTNIVGSVRLVLPVHEVNL